MEIKLNRGPLNGKRYQVEDYTYDFVIREPVIPKWQHDFLESSFEVREGTYHRSNVKLKDGTRVFEWMGWF